MKAATTADQKDIAYAPAIRITPAIFHILLALAKRPMHGYAIMGAISAMTNDEFSLSAGTLYRTIQKLILDELIIEVAAPVDADKDDERRRYYALTNLGAQIVQVEAERLAKLVKLAKRLGVLNRK